jgi:GT2 family glycosyltransferase
METQKTGFAMKKTIIIILNWNGIAYLKMFLAKVVELSANPETEVCVADNGSTDGSADWIAENFSEVRLIRFDRNWGFAGGYNMAIDQLDAEFFVLINTDIEVTEGWLPPLVRYMEENPDSASCQPKILSWTQKDYYEHAGAAGGFIDKFGYPFCRGRILNVAEKDDGQYDNQVEVFWSSGACMIIRSEAWKRCGGFDAGFFAHMEEIDLCWRLHKAGYRVGFIPGSKVYHIGGGSLNYDSPFKIYLNFRNSLFMLHKNLEDKKLFYILFIRRILDGLAALMFLFTGKTEYFKSVIIAHMEYYKCQGELKQKRLAVKELGEYENDGLILNKSIVLEFYIKGNKTFNDLKIDK